MTRLFFMMLLLGPQLLLGERVTRKTQKASQQAFLASNSEMEAHTEEGTNSTAEMYWDLFGRSGPKMGDIKQGSLGDCWYLAALASIAHSHPNAIRDVFVRRGMTNNRKQVWLLRFLVDGVVTMVALDEMVPTAKRKLSTIDGSFFFANTQNGNDVWPILMEKGLAKVFGSYLSIRGGMGYEAFKAVTQAPVDQYRPRYPSGQDTHVWEDPEKVWNILNDAIQNRFPMTGGTSPNSFGVVDGHEFAIVGTGNDPDHGRTVEVFNPWSANMYRGKLMKKTFQFKGDYFMTFDEFLAAFSDINVARVRDSYKITYAKIPVGKPAALKISMRGNDPFTVQLEWPSRKFVTVHGCARASPGDSVRLLVSKVGVPGSWKAAELSWRSANSNLHVDMQGAGEYLVYAFVSFGGAAWIEEVVVNTYSNEVPTLEMLDNPMVVGREILGFPCRDLTHPSFFSGIFSYFDDTYRALDEPVNGSPAWKLEGGEKILWVNLMAILTTSPSLQKLTRYFSKFDPSTLQCRDENLPVQPPSRQQPEQESVANENTCGWEVGEAVSYHFQDKKTSKWICAEVESAFTDSLKVRYLRTGTADVGCKSEKLKKVTQCKYQEDDELRYFDYQGGAWIDVKVKEVECGMLLLSNGHKFKCDSKMLRYPEHCPFHKNEKALVWSHSKARWTFATVDNVRKNLVTLLFRDDSGIDWEKKIMCREEHLLRKLSRCEKVSHDQIARFRNLDNFQALLSGQEDVYFKPRVESIGPAGADCGDSAQGGAPEPCGKFNFWGAISEVLH